MAEEQALVEALDGLRLEENKDLVVAFACLDEDLYAKELAKREAAGEDTSYLKQHERCKELIGECVPLYRDGDEVMMNAINPLLRSEAQILSREYDRLVERSWSLVADHQNMKQLGESARLQELRAQRTKFEERVKQYAAMSFEEIIAFKREQLTACRKLIVDNLGRGGFYEEPEFYFYELPETKDAPVKADLSRLVHEDYEIRNLLGAYRNVYMHYFGTDPDIKTDEAVEGAEKKGAALGRINALQSLLPLSDYMTVWKDMTMQQLINWVKSTTARVKTNVPATQPVGVERVGPSPLDLKYEGDELAPSMIIWAERKLLEPGLDPDEKKELDAAVLELRDAAHL